MDRSFTVKGATPDPVTDHIRFETLRSLLLPAPCWPDGTPRWKSRDEAKPRKTITLAGQSEAATRTDEVSV